MKMEDMPGTGAAHGKTAGAGVIPALPEEAPLRDRPGPRMYHRHILEHEDLGVMGIVDVQA